MKTGRISKPEETFIKENVNFGYQKLALSLDRNPDSVLDFIKRKVAKNEIEKPSWFDSISTEDQAKYDLTFRPYFVELKQQFTEDELKLFQYHWSRIISQFQDDVIPTEELQVVDLIKLELLMNRSLKGNKENLEQISVLETLIFAERQRDPDQIDKDVLFNMASQIASLKASQESLNKDYRELQTKKSSMLKDMKATREQRVQRFQDSKSSFTGWMTYLITNQEVARSYGLEMEKMRLSMYKEQDRLAQYHKYNDGTVDQPFLTPETVKD